MSAFQDILMIDIYNWDSNRLSTFMSELLFLYSSPVVFVYK